MLRIDVCASLGDWVIKKSWVAWWCHAFQR